MTGREAGELLLRLQEGAVQPRVALKCECENLETVYIRIESESVCVTDDHRTFQYLECGGDTSYVKTSDIDLNMARRLCEGLKVEFKDAPVDGFPSIECFVEPNQPIAEVVKRVAEAIDCLFHYALKAADDGQ